MQICAWSDSLWCTRTCGPSPAFVQRGRLERRAAVRGHLAEHALEGRDQVVADHAADADHHPVRRVPAVDVVEERVAVRALDRVLRAERLPAERVVAEHQRLVDRADVVARRVEVHVHLLEDHALLALDLLGVELRVADHVEQHVERDVAVGAGAADVVARVLLRGEGVELAADPVDERRQVARARPALGALEEHVLGEVGDAAVRLLLVARPGGEHHEARDRLRVRQRRGEDAQPVVQRLALEHGHGAMV